MDERMKKGLALAALAEGVWVEYNSVQNAWFFDIPHSVRTAWGDTPLDALAAAAIALGLSPDPDILPDGVAPKEPVNAPRLIEQMTTFVEVADRTQPPEDVRVGLWVPLKEIRAVLAALTQTNPPTEGKTCTYPESSKPNMQTPTESAPSSGL